MKIAIFRLNGKLLKTGENPYVEVFLSGLYRKETDTHHYN